MPCGRQKPLPAFTLWLRLRTGVPEVSEVPPPPLRKFLVLWLKLLNPEFFWFVLATSFPVGVGAMLPLEMKSALLPLVGRGGLSGVKDTELQLF